MTIVWSGLALGAIYAVVAMTFNIGFMASGVLNFAQPQFVMLATFIIYLTLVTLKLPAAVAIAVTLIVIVVAGVVQELVTIRPIPVSRQHPAVLVTTVGASLAISGAVVAIWGPDPLGVNLFPYTPPIRLLGGLGGVVPPVDIVLVGFACVCALGLEMAGKRTQWGLNATAAAEDRDAAALRGINARRLITISIAIAGLLSALLGLISVDQTFAISSLGTDYTVLAFVALAIGGFGSNWGALAGGFLVGLIEALSSRYLGTSFSDVSVFIVLLIVLLAKPGGLFGAPEGRRV